MRIEAREYARWAFRLVSATSSTATVTYGRVAVDKGGRGKVHPFSRGYNAERAAADRGLSEGVGGQYSGLVRRVRGAGTRKFRDNIRTSGSFEHTYEDGDGARETENRISVGAGDDDEDENENDQEEPRGCLDLQLRGCSEGHTPQSILISAETRAREENGRTRK